MIRDAPSPLLLLPGLLSDETVWAAQIAAFPDRSPRSVDYGVRTSLTAMAEAALAVAPPRFALAGHSMGARVALEVCRLAPERVDRLAMISTGIHPVSRQEPAKRQVLVDLARAAGMAALCEAWLPPMIHPDRRDDPALRAPMAAMVERPSLVRFEAQIAALLARPPAEPVLRALRCPLLVAVGRQDAWSPPAQHEEIVALAPRGRLAVIEGSGHMLPVEQPDALNAVLAEWLVD